MFMAGNSSQKTVTTPNRKMQKNKSKLKEIVRLKGFTLLELLIVMSIIALLMGIFLPHLNRAKEQAFELGTFEAEVDEEGNVRLEIRKTRNALYMIKIDRPRNCHTSIREPYIFRRRPVRNQAMKKHLQKNTYSKLVKDITELYRAKSPENATVP